MEESTQPSSEKKEPPKWNKEVKLVKKTNTGKQGEYQTVCGEILVDSTAKEKPMADAGKVFYTAYFLNKKKMRPVLFLFNGGPGSSSIWLHFGGFGPKRVNHLDVEARNPSVLVENSESLLDVADLVFVDPIGTGFSTCAEGELKNFCTEKADVVYLSQFITRFLAQHQLWDKSVFLCGESYGGYRVSLLAQQLIKKESLHPAGLLFVAPFISGVGIEDASPNILAESHYLVGFILAAWYHKRSAWNQTYKNEKLVYTAAREFAYQEYLPARLQNNFSLLNPKLQSRVSALTGIPVDILIKKNLNMSVFSEHLFKGEKRFPGRIDSRYMLEHPMVMTEKEYLDPSTVTLNQRLGSLTQAYYFKQMSWRSDKMYKLSSDAVSQVWRYEEPFYASAFHALQSALKLSPKLRVYAAAGYYDLAVPAATIDFDLKQMADTKSLTERVHLDIFSAGHMMYVQDTSREKLSQAMRKFMIG